MTNFVYIILLLYYRDDYLAGGLCFLGDVSLSSKCAPTQQMLTSKKNLSEAPSSGTSLKSFLEIASPVARRTLKIKTGRSPHGHQPAHLYLN
jgi:hypothetical protein